MDTNFQTPGAGPSSFIPKKPLSAVQSLGQGRGSINFFSLIGTIIFIIALLSAGAAFGYKIMLNRSIEQSQQALARARAAFDPSLVATLSALDARIEGGKEILSTHRAVSGFFELLETLTLRSIRFKSFEYVLVGKDSINVTMKGEGESFSSIALQSDVFAKNKFMKNPIISDLTLEQNGNVGFNFTATIDPTLMMYRPAADVAAPLELVPSVTKPQQQGNIGTGTIQSL